MTTPGPATMPSTGGRDGDQISFPRQTARTRHFTLGVPRAATVAPDGSRVAFLRAPAGDDPATGLWVLDLPSGGERLVADPAALLSGAGEELSPEERARRERSREGAAGVVGYATDRDVTLAAFALSGRLWVADLAGDGSPRACSTATPVVDPRPDPTGTHVAYVAAGTLRVVGVDGADDRALAAPDGPDVTWGLAEFIAAEEMDRHRGFWWSPEGDRLLAARVDESPVQRWHIADPANPSTAPVEVAYPAAGTPNAEVRLAVLSLDGTRVDVRWDADRFPYLVTASWTSHGDPLLLVQTRDQRTTQTLALDTATGATRVVREDTDPTWLEIVPGVPAWAPGGRLVHTVDADDARRLAVDGVPVTPPSMQVRVVLEVGDDGVLVSASTEPTEVHLWDVPWRGEPTPLTTRPGVHAGRRGGGLTVVSRASLDEAGTHVTVQRGREEVARLASRAQAPVLTPRVSLLRAGALDLRTALLLPRDHEPGSRRLPVLMDPYGGPHAQRVLAAQAGFLTSQWFADQGFAVVVADGRGTPGRGPAWEREVAGDLATPPLEDQVDALRATAEAYPDDLDLDRVAIRGWSFGGYLAALAVLRRPDVFHAAVAGAPVTDMSLYDTHYTERYLGTPQDQPEAYAHSSVLADAAALCRPLMIVHGLADDNVVVAHTLRLSSALLAAGRPHTVLPLTGVTHMASQEVVAENLLLLQVAFLREALGPAA
ncbi:MAG: prolyl oligopeptidase family serine peptidase [Actinomycetes bacterium]